MIAPYYSDDRVQLFHGKFEEVLPQLDPHEGLDLILADPPYGETSLDWDRWPHGWPEFLSKTADSMWCTGSMRMFLEHHDEFTAWKLSHDVVWEKHNGSGFRKDQFRRIHDHALFWYRGAWAERYHVTPTEASARKRTVRSKNRPQHHQGKRADHTYVTADGGPLLMTSVIYARSMHGTAINETEKPITLLDPLIDYACPPGGRVLDPFAGSGSTLVAVRNRGGYAVGIEMRESQCEKAAQRLSQGVLDFSGETA